MNVYTSNIITGLVMFPIIAFVITLPYMIYQYRKFGSIPWLRTLVVYSFVFYMLVAYFMVILPLPADRSAVVPYAQTPQLVPFTFLSEIANSTTISLTDPTSWLKALRNPYVYEALFNVLLLVPLGMYLRYYFRRTWWQTLLLGFATTLFYEMSQLTGLWGIYAHPYRLFDVNDLILNTLGAMVGFWLVGPAMRTLPDIRLVNEEAREAGLRASVTRRALSFGIDLAIAVGFVALLLTGASLFGALDVVQANETAWNVARPWVGIAAMLVFFVIVPSLTHGQTLGQKLLRLRIVRSDASPARWFNYLGRYGLLYLMLIVPFVLLLGLMGADAAGASELGGLKSFLASHQQGLLVAWFLLVGTWIVSLMVRAARAALKKRPFIMLNGLLSNTRVMTDAGVEQERERRAVLDVSQVVQLEHLIAEDGTPLYELMDRAGRAVADEVLAWVPDPAPVVVLAGSGNNGGDGWVVAHALSEKGYPVTLVSPELAERMHAEPARSTALDVFADASARRLPLAVLISPDADVLADAIDRAEAVVDAMLGTGFSGNDVREPYAGWIKAANRRRFEGARGKGRGLHRKRTHERGDHDRTMRKSAPPKVKDAPFAIAIDVPSGVSAQTGEAARPAFAADMTVTMIAFKPGLAAACSTPWTGMVKLAKLVDAKPYLARLAENSAAETSD